MYLAAALRPADLAQAQSALLLVSTVLGNVSPMVFSAMFFGDREAMTSGYMVATAMYATCVAAVVFFLPRQLPAGTAGREDVTSVDVRGSPSRNSALSGTI